MILTQKSDCIHQIEAWVDSHTLPRLITSHTALVFCYGILLFLYELFFVREYASLIHPFLIAWAGGLFLYDVVVRRFWSQIPLWKILFLFAVSATITSVLNMNASGMVGSVKALIMTCLPLVAFYPLCLLVKPSERKKTLLFALSGAAVVIFFSSAIALVMFMLRYSHRAWYRNGNLFVGIQLYDDRFPDSGIILNGLYHDINHAAAYAIFFAIYSVVLILACRNGIFKKRYQNVLGIVFGTANLIVQLCYFPLANSRGGWLSLCATLFFSILFYLFFHRLTGTGAFMRSLGALAGAVLCTALVLGGLATLRDGLSYLSIELNRPPAVTEPADTPETPPVEIPPAEEQQPPKKPLLPPEEQFIPEGSVARDSFNKPNTNEFGSRPAIWKESLLLYTLHPIFGENPGNNAYYANEFFDDETHHLLRSGAAVHNSYLDLLLDYGLVGFILLMGFFALCIWAVLKRMSKGSPLGFEYYLAAGGVIMCASASFLLSCVFISTTAMYYALLIMTSYLMSYTKPDPGTTQISNK